MSHSAQEENGRNWIPKILAAFLIGWGVYNYYTQPPEAAGLRVVVKAGHNLIKKGADIAEPKLTKVVGGYDGNNLAATASAGMVMARQVRDEREVANAWKYGSEGKLDLRNRPHTAPGDPNWQNKILLTKTAPIEIYDVSGTIEAEECSGVVPSGPLGIPLSECLSKWPLTNWLMPDVNRHRAHVGRICEGEGCNRREGGTVFLVGEGVKVCAEGDPSKPRVVVVGRTGFIQTGINDHAIRYSLHKSGMGFEGYRFSHRHIPPEACF